MLIHPELFQVQGHLMQLESMPGKPGTFISNSHLHDVMKLTAVTTSESAPHAVITSLFNSGIW